jgi:hypothetical protein
MFAGVTDKVTIFSPRLCQPRHEGMVGVVEPVIDSSLAACGIVGALVAIGSHGTVKVDSPQVRLAPVTREADMMEWEDVALGSSLRETCKP